MTKKKFCLIASVCLVFLTLTGCSNGTEADSYSTTVFAMDTVMELKVYGNEEPLEEAKNLILELEEKLSATSPQSDIYNLNQNGSGAVSPDTYELLQSSLALCERSKGALDISIYPVVQAWGFTTDEKRVPSEAELAKLLKLVDYKAINIDKKRIVTLAPEMKIDLGSVAKGYTGNRLVDLLSERGITSAVLNLGGNVHVIGTKPDGTAWSVGISNPAGEGYAGVVEAVDKAVVTSGGYERFFEQDGIRYHHIIDPSTGYPVSNSLLSVTVVGDDGLVCDALSTALFVMGEDKAAKLWNESNDFEAVFITTQGISITEGLEDAFSPLGDYENTKLTVLRRDGK